MSTKAGEVHLGPKLGARITEEELNRQQEIQNLLKKVRSLNYVTLYPEHYLLLAKDKIDTKQFNEALALVTLGLTQHPERPRTHASLFDLAGQIHSHLGHLREAEDSYRAATKVDTQYTLPHNNLGLLLQRSGRIDEAETAFRTVVSINPDEPDAHNNLGVLFAQTGDDMKALDEYETAIRIDPTLSYPYNNLGLLQANMGQDDNAKNNYLSAIKTNPNNASPHVNLGQLFAKKEEFDKAIKHYKKAVYIDQGYSYAYQALGVAYFNKGDLKNSAKYHRKALKSYRHSVIKNPRDAQAHNDLGYQLQHFSSSPQLSEAETEYKEAIAINPKNTWYHQNLANLLETTDRPEEAQKHWDIAAKLKAEAAQTTETDP